VRALARLIALPLLALPVAAEEPGEPQSGKVMRLLRRDAAGEWKIARTIYN